MTIPTQSLLTPGQAAAYLGLAEGTLTQWRCNKRYDLPYIKVGTCVRYRQADLDAFLTARTVGGVAASTPAQTELAGV